MCLSLQSASMLLFVLEYLPISYELDHGYSVFRNISLSPASIHSEVIIKNARYRNTLIQWIKTSKDYPIAHVYVPLIVANKWQALEHLPDQRHNNRLQDLATMYNKERQIQRYIDNSSKP